MHTHVGLSTVVALLLAAAPAAQAQEPTRAVTHIAGDVYRFQNNNHFSVFAVTPEGVIATDPINAEAAAWLEAEIDQRFGQPVRWLIYSHHHADHVSGGEVFDDTAEVIAQENAAAAIQAEGVPTAAPERTFADSMTLEAGGKTVELTYVGTGHSDNLAVMVFRPENVGFVVDIAAPNRLPYRDFPGADIDGWIEGLKIVEGLDYEILAPGHGALGTPADVTANRVYIETLRAAVLDGLKAGKSDDELAAEITMADYSDWSQYEAWRELNVRGMAAYLRQSGAVN